MGNSQDTFPSEVIDRLRYYVYRLIDPRNGETFYVGKGVGNRVFAHVRGELGSDEDEPGAKLQRIRAIRLAGFVVAHVIHRHGMDARTALEVEAALLDAYPGLTNLAGGAGSEFGSAHARQIIERYAAPPAVFRHKAILISINNSAEDVGAYEGCRYAWKISLKKAPQAEFVLATLRGLIVGVFVPERWLSATSANFQGRPDRPGRYGFEGREAEPEIQRLYFRKRVPDEFRKKGAANPIRYTW